MGGLGSSASRSATEEDARVRPYLLLWTSTKLPPCRRVMVHVVPLQVIDGGRSMVTLSHGLPANGAGSNGAYLAAAFGLTIPPSSS